MKVIVFNRIAKFLQLILLALLMVACNGKKDSKTFQKPNIIYILADDLGYGDLSCYGQLKFQTPNIDRMAAEGMLFTQHYSGSTVCAPSRSSLMTGKHTGHTFIRGNLGVKPEGQFPIAQSVVTIAEYLKSAGYVTGAYGKWGLGSPASEGDPNRQGFDEFYGYNCQTLAHNYFPYHLWHNQTKVELEGNKLNKKETYAPDLIHQEVLSFIEQNKDTTFFLYYPSIVPHAELVAPEIYMDKFRGKFLPEVSYEGTDDGVRYKKGGYSSQKESHAAFAAMVSLLDQQVGEVREKLEELGLAENTLIIFTSDNGPHREGGADPVFFNSNSDFRGFKRDVYEGGIRVPMIACWPGKIAANKSSDHVSAFWDFFPTACDVAAIDHPDNIEGISFLPELLGQEQNIHPFLYWEFHEQGGKQAVRLGDWKGVRLEMQDNPDAKIELYNLSTDRGENFDVAADHPDVIKKMADIMKNEHKRSDAFSFEYEKK